MVGSMGKIALGLLLLSLGAGCASSCDDRADHRKAPGFRVDLPERARSVIEQAEVVEILALSPETVTDGGALDVFHTHRVLGRATLDEPDRRALADLLLTDIGNHKSTMVACNEPHHGFRFTRGADEHVDLVMSFGCLHGTLFEAQRRTTVLTSAERKPKLDTLFAKYKLASGK